MRNNDDRMLEEAYEQMNEGIFRRSDARAGTRMAGLGAKALGGLGKAVGKVSQRAGETIQKGATQIQGDVDAKRLEQLVALYVGDIEKLMNKMQQDVQKMGLDAESLAANPEAAAANPKVKQIGYVYGGLKNAINAGKSIAGQTQAPAQSFRLSK